MDNVSEQEEKKKREPKTGLDLQLHVTKLMKRNLDSLPLDDREVVVRHLHEHVRREQEKAQQEKQQERYRQSQEKAEAEMKAARTELQNNFGNQRSQAAFRGLGGFE